jgi:hypothetical protein
VDRHHGRRRPLLGGRIDAFTQLTSGLANDVVYGAPVGRRSLVCHGGGRQPLEHEAPISGAIFNERNTPMNEIWTYA